MYSFVWTKDACTFQMKKPAKKPLKKDYSAQEVYLRERITFFKNLKEKIWVKWTHQMPTAKCWLKSYVASQEKGCWRFQAEEIKESALKSKASSMPIPDGYTTGHINLDLFPQSFQCCSALDESSIHLGP